jgi:putative membrane protein
MGTIAQILIGLIALEHLFFLWLEMFAWETTGRKVFSEVLPEKLFLPTKNLAANQGLYNGFLAAGLLWTFFISDPLWKTYISIFFLGCITIAGIYGGITTSNKILLLQALPAIVAILFVLVS